MRLLGRRDLRRALIGLRCQIFLELAFLLEKYDAWIDSDDGELTFTLYDLGGNNLTQLKLNTEVQFLGVLGVRKWIRSPKIEKIK